MRRYSAIHLPESYQLSGRFAVLLPVMLLVLIASACTAAPTAPAAVPTTAPPATSAAPTTAASGGLQKITVMLDWVPNTNHTGLYVALDKGWYRDQGLDVQIIQPGEGATPVQVVAAGKAEFGVSYQEETTLARAQDVPVVSIAAVIQHNTSSFAAPASKGIKRPKDFEGKKYGAFGSPTEHAVLEVLMKCDGGDVNKVDFVDIGATDFFVATQRDVDFAWIFDGWTGIEAKLRNVPLTEVRLRDWAQCIPDYYTPILVTGEGLIARQPELAKRFMAATSQGYQFAADNPGEAADILIKHTPETNPELIRQSQTYLAKEYRAEAPRWGEQKQDVWQRYADWMADRGVLPKRIDASKAFTNQFLP